MQNNPYETYTYHCENIRNFSKTSVPKPQLPNGKELNNYDPKPYRTGTYVLGPEEIWFYSANPQNYTSPEFKFWQSPDHMKVEN
jgi:hypothetical protein